MTDYKFTTTEEDAPKVLEWLKSRGGLALWRSIDLSDPGASAATPARTEDGKPYPKPHWKFAEKPEEVLTDLALVEVVAYKEAKRFHVAVRRGDSLNFTLTHGSSDKLKKAVAKAGEGAIHVFDYGAQEAIILVPERARSLAEWAKEQPRV